MVFSKEETEVIRRRCETKGRVRGRELSHARGSLTPTTSRKLNLAPRPHIGLRHNARSLALCLCVFVCVRGSGNVFVRSQLLLRHIQRKQMLTFLKWTIDHLHLEFLKHTQQIEQTRRLVRSHLQALPLVQILPRRRDIQKTLYYCGLSRQWMLRYTFTDVER